MVPSCPQKLGELGSIPLAALADLPGYVPPPLTSVIALAWRWLQ